MGWSVMVFAAGFGTRMKHLTKTRPKPMIPVAGTPLIDHALALTEHLPDTTIVVNLHYKADILETHLRDKSVTTLREEPRILDTGGGLRHALPLLGSDPVITLNSDAIWHGANPLAMLTAGWNPDQMDGLLVCVPPKNAIGHAGPGNFVADGEGRIRRGDGWIYGGAQIIKTDMLQDIGEDVFSLNRLWDIMIAKNSLYALEYDGMWCDVGHPEGISLAERMLRTGDV